MANIQEMRDKYGKLLKQCRDILDAAEAAKRVPTAEEDQQYNTLMEERKNLHKSIQREEELQTLERDASQSIDDPVKPEVRKTDPPDKEKGDRSAAIMKGFRRYVLLGDSHEYRTALQVDIDTSGGYISAPPAFVPEVLKDLDSAVIFRTLATVRQVGQSGSLGYPRITSKMSGAVHGSEIGDIPEMTNPEFGRREWFPHPITGWVSLSNTLLRKAILDPETILRQEIVRLFAETEEEDFMTGDGVDKSLGIFTASDKGISTSRDVSTGNTSTSITLDGLKAAKYALKQGYWNQSSWIFQTEGVEQIDKLKDGEGRYVWSDNIQNGGIPRLLGFQVYISDFAPHAFTASQYVGMLGAYKNYLIADGLGMEIRRLSELKALNDLTVFLARLEVDGMPKMEEAFVRVKLSA